MEEHSIIWRSAVRRVWSKGAGDNGRCFRSAAGFATGYPRFHRLSTGDNDGQAREDLDLGRDVRKGVCASRGAYFKPEVGLVDWPRMKRQ